MGLANHAETGDVTIVKCDGLSDGSQVVCGTLIGQGNVGFHVCGIRGNGGAVSLTAISQYLDIADLLSFQMHRT